MPYAEEPPPLFHSRSLLVYSRITSSRRAVTSHCESLLLPCHRFCLPAHQRVRPRGDSIQAQLSPSHQLTSVQTLLASPILESPASVIRSCFVSSTQFLIKRPNSGKSRRSSLKLHWKQLTGITIPEVQTLLVLKQITILWSCCVLVCFFLHCFGCFFFTQNYIQLNAY